MKNSDRLFFGVLFLQICFVFVWLSTPGIRWTAAYFTYLWIILLPAVFCMIFFKESKFSKWLDR